MTSLSRLVFACLAVLPVACADPGPAAAPPDSAPADPTVVEVAQGTLKGVLDGAVLRWNGIPFAAPPVGELRWRPPAPAAPWSAVRDASRYASECTQAPDEVMPSGTPTGSEDCLYLNVNAPAARAGEVLPVIVFVHGGGWITGDSSATVYNTPSLPANGPAIVVTINYRLGALGFLSLADLANEDANHVSGNYGLLDQIAALQWIHDNIAAFGGDPSRVLFWGQSAGGASALMQLASPLGHGLFSAVFAQSGGQATGRLLSRALAAGTTYAASLGCSGSDVPACLRALPAATAESLPPTGFTWGPVVDGHVLPHSPPAMFAAGTQNHVPAIIGTTSAEYANPTALAVPQVSTITSEEAYEAALVQNFGAANLQAVLARYPATSYPSAAAAYVAAISDANMTCAARRMVRSLASTQSEPVYRYLFTHTDSAGPRASLGPAHGVDFPFWFDAFLTFTPDASEAALARAMSSDLLQFAATADATGPSSTTWPRADASVSTLVLDDAIQIVADPGGPACDFWDSLATSL